MAFRYRDGIRIMEPYTVVTDREQEFNYIFGWCVTHKDYRNYRLSNIIPTRLLKVKQEHFDKAKADEVKKHFDPFLSTGRRLPSDLPIMGSISLTMSNSSISPVF
ncbi:MAG TPA: WYL domain-containing protein [Candidatus Mcinerneyibacteriales bacterium]|nr:WYL domain-containing protein [Candidatus Mcinerneyibacteriales bacterium]